MYRAEEADTCLMRHLARLIPLIAVLASTGCAARAADVSLSSDSASPEVAVQRFLDVMSEAAVASGSEVERRDVWRRACDAVDPRLRRLRFSPSDADQRASCGAVVTLLALGTGENSGVSSASGISGSVHSSHTVGA